MSREDSISVHTRHRARVLVTFAMGLLLSAGIALPASAAPAAVPDLLTLRSVMTVLNAQSAQVPDSVTGWYVDPATHSVVVSATDEAVARTFVAGRRGVRIQHVGSRPVLMASLHGGASITSSEGTHCSAGFNAISGQTRYLITAGHCTQAGGTWSGPNGSEIGPTVKSSFPGDDFGLIEVESQGWNQVPDVEVDNSYVNVAGVTPAEVGERVCLFGSTSGHHCGRVEAVDETVNYGNGDVVRGLTRTNLCAEGGDSGGPFMSGDQAQGVLSGGTGGCLLGGQSYFQPIQEVLAHYGLTLLTGRGSEEEH